MNVEKKDRELDYIEKKIIKLIDQHAEEIIAFAEDIYHNAEKSFYEYRTSSKVFEILDKFNLDVKKELALTGVKGKLINHQEANSMKLPTVGIIGELDGITCSEHKNANNGIAHACGHHAQLAACIGAAFALTDDEIKANLDGNVTFFAVPAEEYVDVGSKETLRKEKQIQFGSGKSELIRIGEFDDIDIALTTHVHMTPCDKDLLLGNQSCNGFVAKNITLYGKASHAATAPHEGINALNAATIALNTIGLQRETFKEQDYIRIHSVIKKGGDAVNVVPNEVVVESIIRGKTLEAFEDAARKVNMAFEGAAYAFGAKVNIEDIQGYLPVIERKPDRVLMEAVTVLSDEVTYEDIPYGGHNVACTDVGDLTHVKPVINFTHGGFTGALHSSDFKITDKYKAYIIPAKVMALTTYHLLKDNAKEAKQVITEFKPVFTKEEYSHYINKLIEE
jgi:amidohydrolase